MSALEEQVLTRSSEEFERLIDRTHTRLAPHLESARLNVISHEGFSRTTRYLLPEGHDVRRTFSRLQSVFSKFGDVHFILVIRAHSKLLWSNYNTFRGAWSNYGLTFDKLLEIVNGHSDEKKFVVDNFKFYQTYSDLVSVAGDSNVKLMLYENLLDDGEKFLCDLYGLLQSRPTALQLESLYATVNASNTKTSAYRFRQLAKRFPSAFLSSITAPLKFRSAPESPLSQWKEDAKRAWRRARFYAKRPAIEKSTFLAHEREISAYFQEDLSKFRTTKYWPDLVRHNYIREP